MPPKKKGPKKPQNHPPRNVAPTKFVSQKDEGTGKESVEIDDGGVSGSFIFATQSSFITDVKEWSMEQHIQHPPAGFSYNLDEEGLWHLENQSAPGSSTQLPSITIVEGWNKKKLVKHLKTKFPVDMNKEALDILLEQEISGRAFLKHTKEDLTSYGMKGGPASVIAGYAQELKHTSGPPFKKARHDKLTLMDAVELANLTNKTLRDNRIAFSLLNMKDRVSVLGFLGQEVEREEDSFAVLFRTACAFRNEFSSSQQFPDFISAPSDTMELPVIGTSRLYVRKAYGDLYDHIAGAFDDTPTGYTRNHLVITGTSGIGKSVFLVYFIIRLIAESSDDSPPIIIFQTKNGSKCYAFGGTSTLRVGNTTDFEPFLGLHQTWHLIDSSPEPALDKAQTLIAVSPKTYRSESMHYHAIDKALPRMYHMAPWELDEVNKCRERVFPHLPQDIMMELYAKIGGVPRYVLEVPAFRLRFKPDDIDDAKNAAFSRIREAIGAVQSASRLLQYLARGQDSLEHSSRLLHRWPNDKHDNFHLEWASTHIQEEIVKALSDQAWGKLLDNLVTSEQDIERGKLFELYILHIFRKGGQTFTIKKLEGTPSSSALIIPNNPPVTNFINSTELSSPANGTLFIPINLNFPCIDAFLAPHDLFQITVSSNHPIRQYKLLEIVKNILGESGGRLRLFFVVPAEIFGGFGKQNYLMENGRTCKDADIPDLVADCVEQYALKIDLRAASLGRSPGVGNGPPY